MEILSIIMDTQLGNVFAISLAISVIFFIINVFINDVFFDLICGLTYSVLFGSTIGLFLGETTLTDNVYVYVYVYTTIFFGLYLLFMFITYKYISKMAEQSNTINKKDFEGEIATVVTTIPENGMGEVLITASMQKVAMPAKIYRDSNTLDLESIAQGQKVLVITSDNPYVEVIPYKPMFN